MTHIAWTLPNSERGLGSVLLRAQLPKLTRDILMGSLATRINRLIRKETPPRAAALLRQYEDQEGFSLVPATAGLVLAENSDRLWEAVCYQGPIKGPLEHNPAIEEFLASETLEEFLVRLYPTERE